MPAHRKDHGPHESSPLLPKDAQKRGSSLLFRALLCGCMVSLSFGVTQVPLIYVFRLMTCDAYYEIHPEPAPGTDRCDNHEIEAATALSVSLLGSSTTVFGVMNLFVTGWTIKKLGIKSALAIQVFWPAVRLLVQNIGVMTGSNAGILIIQCSQIITIIGGPAGYLLALNSFVTDVVEPSDRTGALGKLQGCTMFGTAAGYLAGGLISESFGILAPFRVTLSLFLLCCVYVLLFLPWLPPTATSSSPASKGITRFFGPLKIFAPQRWVLTDGRIKKEHGAILLGIGVFLGTLATGYIPALLQMYSTDVLGFGTAENGYLVSLFSLLRGVFLTFLFPRIISHGRIWYDKRHCLHHSQTRIAKDSETPELPTEPSAFADVEPMDHEDEPVEPPVLSNEHETFAFDLQYTKFSLLADGLLTGAATFVRKGWQIYLISAILPFAAGTAAAAKGTILQMLPAVDRADALSAISLVDMVARLATTSIFGPIFAAFATLGKPYLVFTCNAAVALLGVAVLMFCRFPPDGSQRYGDIPTEEPEQEPEQEQEQEQRS